jgi:hypothetical protein
VSLKIQARIEGVERLQAIMKSLPAQVARRVLRPALNAEGSKVVTQSKLMVPKSTGLLKKSIGKKTKTYTQTGNIVVVVGPRTSFRQMVSGKPRDPVKYAHLVEFGAKPHFLSGAKGHKLVSYRDRNGNLKMRQRRAYTAKMHPGAKAQKPFTNAYKYGLVGAADRMAARMAIEIEKQAAKGAFGRKS